MAIPSIFYAGGPANVLKKWKEATARYRNGIFGHFTGIKSQYVATLGKVDEDLHQFALAYPGRHANPYYYRIRETLIEDGIAFICACGGQTGVNGSTVIRNPADWGEITTSGSQKKKLSSKDVTLNQSSAILRDFATLVKELREDSKADAADFGTYVGPISYTHNPSGLCHVRRTVGTSAQTLVIFASRLSFAPANAQYKTDKSIKIVNAPHQPQSDCKTYVKARLDKVAKVIENPMALTGNGTTIPEYLIFPPTFANPETVVGALSESGLILNSPSPSVPNAQFDVLFKTSAGPLELHFILSRMISDRYKQIVIVTEQEQWVEGSHTPHFAGDGSRNFLGAHRAKG